MPKRRLHNLRGTVAQLCNWMVWKHTDHGIHETSRHPMLSWLKSLIGDYCSCKSSSRAVPQPTTNSCPKKQAYYWYFIPNQVKGGLFLAPKRTNGLHTPSIWWDIPYSIMYVRVLTDLCKTLWNRTIAGLLTVEAGSQWTTIWSNEPQWL